MRILHSNLRTLHILVILTLIASSGCKRAADVAGGHAPNRPSSLLLVTMDTTRADHLGCYGYSQKTSPNIDRLAAEGTHFTAAITPVPLTRPSHASILTGLLPQHHGIWSNGPYRLEPNVKTIGERLPGFRTCAVISSYVLAASFGLNRGFQYYDDHLHERPGEDPERRSEETVTAAEQWIRQQAAAPFFLWIHFYDPHFPYVPPEPYRSRFASPYDGEIAAMDHGIGEILDMLDKKGLLQQTLVVLVGDHGEGLGEHGELTHGYFLYDTTVRVPLIFRGPGVPRGKVISRTVALSALASTVLDALAHPAPAGEAMDGKSFWSELQNQSLPPSVALMENRSIHYQFGWAALAGIRTESWKWLNSPIPELYDLERDPGETNNLAGSNTPKAEELKKLWQKAEPPDRAERPASLTPEEEERLASLGYLSAGKDSGSDLSGPDPKKFAPLTGKIEEIIRLRQQNRVLEAEPSLREILSADPGNRFALRVQGDLLLQKGQYREALTVLQRLSSSYENHPETLALLATAYERTGDPKHAVEYYEKASEPPWIYWPALESLARLSQRVPSALSGNELQKKFESLAPQSYREIIPLARAYAILGRFDRAGFWYAKAMEAEPSETDAIVGYAQMLAHQGKTREAIDLLRKVQPPTVESLFVLGGALQAIGSTQDACAAYAACLQKNPTNPNLLAGLSRALQQCSRIHH